MATLTVEVIPEKYIPLWSKNGYEDHFNDFPTTNGIFCRCTKRKTIFNKKHRFKAHCRGKLHKRYLLSLLETETNPLKRVDELTETVRVQKIIIKAHEKELDQLRKIVRDHAKELNDMEELLTDIN